MPSRTQTLPPIPDPADPQLLAYLNLKLHEIGQPGVVLKEGEGLSSFVDHFLTLSREKDRVLASHLCPVDQRVQAYLEACLAGAGDTPRLPATTLVLDRPGLARALSLPAGRDEHHSSILASHRLRQGVLHNPRSDRRTTQGIFHVAEGGLPADHLLAGHQAADAVGEEDRADGRSRQAGVTERLGDGLRGQR